MDEILDDDDLHKGPGSGHSTLSRQSDSEPNYQVTGGPDFQHACAQPVNARPSSIQLERCQRPDGIECAHDELQRHLTGPQLGQLSARRPPFPGPSEVTETFLQAQSSSITFKLQKAISWPGTLASSDLDVLSSEATFPRTIADETAQQDVYIYIDSQIRAGLDVTAAGHGSIGEEDESNMSAHRIAPKQEAAQFRSPITSPSRQRQESQRSLNNVEFNHASISPAKDLSLEGCSPISFSSLETSDSEDSDDTDECSSLADFTWVSTESSLDPSHPLLPLEAAVIVELIQSYHAQEGIGVEAPVNSSTTPVSFPRSNEGVQTRRRKFGDDQRQLSETQDRSGPIAKRARKQTLEGELRLACHFQKLNPEKHAACGIREKGFRDIAQIKQHLKRNHGLDPYCPRCKGTFTTEEERDEHINLLTSSPCQKSDAPLDGLTPKVIEGLKTKVNKDHSLAEQWFSVWDQIFPGMVRPRSCTFDLDSGIHIQALDLGSHFERVGPGRVLAFLRSRDIFVGSVNGGISAQDADVFIRRTLTQAFQQISQEWQSQRTPTEGCHNSRDARPATATVQETMEPQTPSPMNQTALHAVNPSHLAINTGPDSEIWADSLLDGSLLDGHWEMNNSSNLDNTEAFQQALLAGENAQQDLHFFSSEHYQKPGVRASPHGPRQQET